MIVCYVFFFFQAEDGIRDYKVTGVQTCALPISRATSAQQVVKFGEGQTLTISGFVSATLFNDRGLFSSFGQGQNAEIAACRVPIPGCTGQPGVNQGIFDGDVRNTRINFTFNAPPVLGKWAPRA